VLTRPSIGWETGGELLQSTSHGSVGAYDKDAKAPVTTASIHDRHAQIHFAINASCSSGAPVILQNWAADIASLGALNAGKTFGEALLGADPIGDPVRAIYYGDMSLRLHMAPANAMPTVTTFTADKVVGVAPLAVNFAANASDPDDAITKYEWYPEGHASGRVPAKASGPTVRALLHTYVLLHRYNARVEVVDSYRARHWKDIDIRVAPTPGQPLRVRCGTSSVFYESSADVKDASGGLWLHEQAYADGTWGVQGKSATSGKPIGGDILGTTDDEVFRMYRYDPKRNGFPTRFHFATALTRSLSALPIRTTRLLDNGSSMSW
jgi:hypothetical protein